MLHFRGAYRGTIFRCDLRRQFLRRLCRTGKYGGGTGVRAGSLSPELLLDNAVDLQIRISADGGGKVTVVSACEPEMTHTLRRVPGLPHAARLIGEHTGRCFSLGQRLEVEVKKANKTMKYVDFILGE